MERAPELCLVRDHLEGRPTGVVVHRNHALREAIAEQVEELEGFHEASARPARPHRRAPGSELWVDVDRET